jgi:hypothetical protein
MSFRPVLGPTQSPVLRVQATFSTVLKRPGCEADHSPSTSAEVKQMWIYTSIPPFNHRDNFYLTFMLFEYFLNSLALHSAAMLNSAGIYFELLCNMGFIFNSFNITPFFMVAYMYFASRAINFIWKAVILVFLLSSVFGVYYRLLWRQMKSRGNFYMQTCQKFQYIGQF